MNPSDFLTVARDLADKESPTAAELRTAVGRAYYALFNSAVLFLGKCGVAVRDTQQGHREVPKALRQCGDAQLRNVAADLDSLRTTRWEADYDMNAARPEHQKTVKKDVAHARQASRDLETCAADAARFQAVRQALRNWAAGAAGTGFQVK
jgi:hypothetical protein